MENPKNVKCAFFWSVGRFLSWFCLLFGVFCEKDLFFVVFACLLLILKTLGDLPKTQVSLRKWVQAPKMRFRSGVFPVIWFSNDRIHKESALKR